MSQPESSHFDAGSWISTKNETSSSPETNNLTPDSSNGEASPHRGEEEEEHEQEGDMAADPLLRPGQGEVYELRQGVRRKRPRSLNLDSVYNDDDNDDDDDDDDDDDGHSHTGHDDDEDGEDVVYTAEEERAVVRKFDRRLVLFVALLYLLSFLDRSSSSLVSSLVFSPTPHTRAPLRLLPPLPRILLAYELSGRILRAFSGSCAPPLSPRNRMNVAAK